MTAPAAVALSSSSSGDAPSVAVDLHCGRCGRAACRLTLPPVPRVESFTFEARTVMRQVARLVLRKRPELKRAADAYFADDLATVGAIGAEWLTGIEAESIRCVECMTTPVTLT